jgi:glutamyl-tRNA reductase
MAILALGINHATASIALRERVAIPPDRASEALKALRDSPGVQAAAILSTCNRTELYVDHEPGYESQPLQWLSDFHRLTAHELTPALYRHQDKVAVRHLFRVATGLDSLVLGEPQILGQLKQAYRQAQDARTLSGPLERLLQRSFAVAKTIRTETELGANAVSVAYAAVRLALQIFDEMPKRHALLIGAGETVELAARHLLGAGLKRITVANRTLERAYALAHRIGGQACRLDELEAHLAEADIVISAVHGESVLKVETLRRAFTARRHRPMFLVDLGVPRNIDPAAARLDDVYLYSVDDLQAVVEEGLRGRRAAAVQAEAMIEWHVDEFMAWQRARVSSESVIRLREQADAARAEVLERARRRLAHGEDPEAVLEYLAQSLTRKLLHQPTVALRTAAELGDAEFLSLSARLLALEPSDPQAGR